MPAPEPETMSLSVNIDVDDVRPLHDINPPQISADMGITKQKQVIDTWLNSAISTSSHS